MTQERDLELPSEANSSRHVQEELLESLSNHIDTLAATSHYFVIDPSETSVTEKSMGSVSASHYSAAVACVSHDTSVPFTVSQTVPGVFRCERENRRLP